MPLDESARPRLHRTALRLAYATVGYNLFEAAVAISAGAAAGSPALLSFGGDSIVESTSALVIVWQFRGRLPEERERRALRFIGLAFFALAVAVTVDAVRALVTGAAPEASPIGIALAILSLIVMPLLVRAKRRVARALDSASVAADSVQSLLCTYLSAVLLIGLLLNAALGWWWADPAAALVVAGLALVEGIEAWRGEADD